MELAPLILEALTVQQQSDIQRVRSAINGDREAFGELVKQYRPAIYTLCCRSTGNVDDAADLTQEVFLSVFLTLRQLRDPAAFPSWIWRVTQHLCVSWKRRRKLQFVSLDDTLEMQCEQQPNRIYAVHQELGKLSSDMQMVVTLHYIDGYSMQEIAHLLDIPQGTVKSRLYHARRRLKEGLMDEYRDEVHGVKSGDDRDAAIIRAIESVQALDPEVLGYLRASVAQNLSLIEGIESNIPDVPRRVWVAKAKDSTIAGVMIAEDFREPVPDTGIAVELRATTPQAIPVLLAQLEPGVYKFLIPSELRQDLISVIPEASDFSEYVSLSLSSGDLQALDCMCEIRQLTTADMELAKDFPKPWNLHEPTLARHLKEWGKNPTNTVIFGAICNNQIASFAVLGWEVDTVWGIWTRHTREEQTTLNIEEALLSHACRHLLDTGSTIIEPSAHVADAHYLAILKAVGFREHTRVFSCRGRV